MHHAYAITATGTGIGKTFTTAALAHQMRAAGHQVRALKPVISGYEGESDSDTSILLEAQGLSATSVDAISPFRFRAPLSPHLAAARENIRLDPQALLRFCRDEITKPGTTLIEGVGGVIVPLDGVYTTLDWLHDLAIPTILVTGSYLGTLSHTLTAALALRQASIPLHAVIVSASDDDAQAFADTVATLRQILAPAPIFALPRLARWQDAPPMLEWLTSWT